MGKLARFLFKPSNLLLLTAAGVGAWLYFKAEFYRNQANHAIQANNYTNSERPLMEVAVTSRDEEKNITTYTLIPYKDDGTLATGNAINVSRLGTGFIVEANRNSPRYTWGAFKGSYIHLDRFLGTAEASEGRDGQRSGERIPLVNGTPPGYVDPALLVDPGQKRNLVQKFFDFFHDTSTRINDEISPRQRNVQVGQRFLISSNGIGRVISEPATNPDAIALVKKRQEEVRQAMQNLPPTFEKGLWNWVTGRFRKPASPVAGRSVPSGANPDDGSPSHARIDGTM